MDPQTKALLVVRSDIAPEIEEAFNEWYDEVHIPDVLALPHWLHCRRFRMAGSARRFRLDGPSDEYDGPTCRYLAVWEIDTVDTHLAEQTLHAALPALREAGRLDIADRMSQRISTYFVEVPKSSENGSNRHGSTRLEVEDGTDADVTAVLQAIRSTQGFVPNSMRVIGRNPTLLAAVRALSSTALHPVRLDPHLAMIAANSCCRGSGDKYSGAHSAYVLRTAHHEPLERLRALADPTAPGPRALFSPAELSVIDTARAAASVPSRVHDQHLDELRRYFDEDQILELFAVVSYFGFLNRFNPMLGTELEPEAQEMLELLHIEADANAREPSMTTSAPVSYE